MALDLVAGLRSQRPSRNFLLVLAPAYASPVLLMLMFPGGLLLMAWLFIKGVDMRQWNALIKCES